MKQARQKQTDLTRNYYSPVQVCYAIIPKMNASLGLFLLCQEAKKQESKIHINRFRCHNVNSCSLHSVVFFSPLNKIFSLTIMMQVHPFSIQWFYSYISVSSICVDLLILCLLTNIA